MSLPPRYAVVDLETTGVHPVRDRITEIAVLRMENGIETGRWQSLVNPGVPIPPMIQRLIGITDAMVADAPAFEALADTLVEWLEGCVFVAHNARFDYGFIRHAFERMGRRFDPPVLCTVKLSRALYPEYPRHGLDVLIERFGLRCNARHRAMGDVETLAEFLRLADNRFPEETLAAAVRRATNAAENPGLPAGILDALPDAPGVYLFYASPSPGKGDKPLYLSHCASLRGRVRPWFADVSRASKSKEAELARKVRFIDWVETPGRFGAMLLELELLKSLRPAENRLPSNSPLLALRPLKNRRRPPVLEYVDIDGLDPRDWSENCYGAFHGRLEAEKRVRELAAVYRLCPQRLGLEPGRAACSAYAVGQCAGVCAKQETPEAHDARLNAALQTLRLKPWPWQGAVFIHEQNDTTRQQSFYLFDRWCYLGSTSRADEVGRIAAGSARVLDLEIYKLLLRWISSPANLERVRMIHGEGEHEG